MVAAEAVSEVVVAASKVADESAVESAVTKEVEATKEILFHLQTPTRTARSRVPGAEPS